MIYFDAGATTLEKPAAVGRAMAQATHAMSSPGRGSYPASRRAEETAYLCRQEAAELLGVPQPENVIITTSATHGLNIAIRSLLGSGDRVVISGYEHNAVTRPLHAIPGLSVIRRFSGRTWRRRNFAGPSGSCGPGRWCAPTFPTCSV